MVLSSQTGLDEFYGQTPEWEAVSDEGLRGLECATVKVPLNYAEPGGRTLSLTVARHRATTRSRGLLMVGPGDDLGNSGLALTAQLAAELPEAVLANFDLVGFDHRFMGRSSPIFCDLEPDERFWVFHYPENFESEIRFQANIAAKVTAEAIDLVPYATSRNICRDMDIIRGSLGADKICYIGYSYGTYLGAVYSEMFGQHLERAVLDSICSPDWVWRGLFTDFPPNGERALRRWATWASGRNDQYGLGADPVAVRRSYDALLARVDSGSEVAINGFPLDRTLARLIAVGILNSERGYPFLADIVKCALDGDGLQMGTMQFLAGMFGEPKEESGTVAQLAILAGDWAWPRNPSTYERDMVEAQRAYPWVGAALSGIKAPAFWPVPPIEPATRLGVGEGTGDVLLVQAELDMSTPHAAAVRMHEVMGRKSRLLTIADTAHHRFFPFYGNAAADELITAYLVDGDRPPQDLKVANPEPMVAAGT